MGAVPYHYGVFKVESPFSNRNGLFALHTPLVARVRTPAVAVLRKRIACRR